MGCDEDIATDPFLYQWPPSPENDSPLRKIQHLIFFVPFSFLFALWRVDSMKVAVDGVEQKRPNAKSELYSLLIHYAFLFTVFPVAVWVPAIFMSGLMSALIVTPTHQSELDYSVHECLWYNSNRQETLSQPILFPNGCGEECNISWNTICSHLCLEASTLLCANA